MGRNTTFPINPLLRPPPEQDVQSFRSEMITESSCMCVRILGKAKRQQPPQKMNNMFCGLLLFMSLISLAERK